eukprot:CAMPEP_0198136494 /NCGR_PEP_ID=MMETSP1443-20131203/145_1 /TAXON_ID=186043 /ORGANISM="Entomoneis sp., Strain CCMP2396" /LENGTH=106 /DNA_ID=CAMNT_0043797721 /DNA_START=33 /DNA_END=353 /DNA_ORIENTATION=+
MAILRQTPASYFNTILAIAMYGFLAKWTWSFKSVWPQGFMIIKFPLTAVFGFLCLLQVFGLITEYLGYNDVLNPWTGEWSTSPGVVEESKGPMPRKSKMIKVRTNL